MSLSLSKDLKMDAETYGITPSQVVRLHSEIVTNLHQGKNINNPLIGFQKRKKIALYILHKLKVTKDMEVTIDLFESTTENMLSVAPYQDSRVPLCL